MKRILAFVCMLSIVLSLGILPASAAAVDSMTLQYVSLRTTEGKEGIYFGANFNLTQETINAMGANGCYGIALTPYALDDWSANMGSKVQASKYTGGLTAGKTTYVRSTSLVNILNISNDNLTNNNNANTTIYVKPYVKLNDGSYIFGEGGQISMKQVAKMVDDIYSTLNNTQRMGLLGMYERFSNVMKGWGLTNLKKHYTSGGYVTVTNENGEEEQISLILQYRRNKVVANMQAQAEVLWSFTGSAFQYSRDPSSEGYENDDQDNVYTLYPGRVYKGIPYSHGAAGLDVYYEMGKQNSDGVYVIENLHSSWLNGGASTSEYNTSRMGNDCWDAISWAYESIGSSVSANQTNQCTPTYGMYPIGPYGEGENSLFNLFLSSNGKTLTTFGDVYTNNFSNNAENRQTIYESYALMHSGDTLVHYVSNAGGHALMAVSVDVQRNNDGTINPDASSVIFIEQGSGHEKAQSTCSGTFSSSAANGHDQNHLLGEGLGLNIPVGDPSKCKECAIEAGYNETTKIWTLNPGQVSRTFTELFDKGYYIPVTSKELSDATFKPASSRISDNYSSYGSNIAYAFTGKLDSTYRISQVTLDIYDASGNKINTSTCFGTQADLTSAFNLARFVTDQTSGAYGNRSVLKGTPALQQKAYTYNILDAEGNQVYVYTAVTETVEGTTYYYNSGTEEAPVYTEVPAEGVAEGTTLYTRKEKTATTKWLEAPDLDAGYYSFTMTYKMANGVTKTFRSGYFKVYLGENADGSNASAHLVVKE